MMEMEYKRGQSAFLTPIVHCLPTALLWSLLVIAQEMFCINCKAYYLISSGV